MRQKFTPLPPCTPKTSTDGLGWPTRTLGVNREQIQLSKHPRSPLSPPYPHYPIIKCLAKSFETTGTVVKVVLGLPGRPTACWECSIQLRKVGWAVCLAPWGFAIKIQPPQKRDYHVTTGQIGSSEEYTWTNLENQLVVIHVDSCHGGLRPLTGLITPKFHEFYLELATVTFLDPLGNIHEIFWDSQRVRPGAAAWV